MFKTLYELKKSGKVPHGVSKKNEICPPLKATELHNER